MLRAVRRRIRMIGYYSAPRRRTAWTRAADIGLFAAVILALPVAALSTVQFQRTGDPVVAQGHFIGEGDVVVEAQLVDEEGIALRRAEGGSVIGAFFLRMTPEQQGWPFASRIDLPQPTLDLDRRGVMHTDAQLEPDDPRRVAIDAALREEGMVALADAWQRGDPPPSWHWLGLAGSALLWWLLLSALAVTTCGILGWLWRVNAARGLSREEQLRRSNRCPTCGYDMRGLEWSERCPECGALV